MAFVFWSSSARDLPLLAGSALAAAVGAGDSWIDSAFDSAVKDVFSPVPASAGLISAKEEGEKGNQLSQAVY